MNKPWEVAELLRRAENTNQKPILSSLSSDDPFWVGASYAIDPFVGIICKLPMFNPHRYGAGVSAKVFDKLVKGILDGSLRGEPLVVALEAFSRYCTEPEWVYWYRPILQGEMNLRLSLDLFNEVCPQGLQIPPPKLSRPKPIQSLREIPKRFFLQPVYQTPRVFWFIDSQHAPHEIRGYDPEIRSFTNPRVEGMFRAFARTKTVDIVVTGHANTDYFVVDDLLSREQFTQETGAFPLHRRLEALAQLGLPPVQMSDVLTSERPEIFLKELNLLFEQGYTGAIVRDLDAHYPFRSQPDLLIQPTVKATATVTEVFPGLGMRFEYTRGKKLYSGVAHLGLTSAVLENISESRGKRFDLVSCGAKDGELLLPVFKQWSIDR